MRSGTIGIREGGRVGKRMRKSRTVRKLAGLSGLLLCVLLAVGCETKEEANGPPPSGGTGPTAPDRAAPAHPSPVTVDFYPAMPLTDADFDKIVVQPVRKKYPHITVNRMGGYLANTFAAGDIPDLIQTHNGFLQEFYDKAMVGDINALVRKHGIDLSRFDGAILDSLRTDKGELLGLPYAVNFTALYYNKAVFDKFGVPYPSDGMTWYDAIDIAKKLSRREGDVAYRGLDPEGVGRIARQAALDYADMKTMKSNMMNPGWRTVFEIAKTIYTIPGNEVKDVNAGNGAADFLQGTVAMMATVNLFDQLGDATFKGLDWDVAEYPSIPGAPHVNTDVDAHILVIPPTAKHKDAAMLVAEAVTSDAAQLMMTKETARLSPLRDPAFKKAFSSDMDFVKGKRIESIFKSRMIPAPIRTKYYSDTRAFGVSNFKDYALGAKNLNTALRDADEQINSYLGTQLGKK
ncbi:extracellular solute-binding protein [Paenibacillus hemerocallicola]|uniref:Extracellular solute-binding protein n=1 Tax=Paenibacillus hemerocallicola TaxID=1172614 RepID=A0A5C4TAQ8_9BACL|nr:extracellular solute-binding protein [Paenibacillus hemerocallicola]TNJ65519.1 extracellular solute-binding protein [Paenibacillus hemerocallicola]